MFQKLLGQSTERVVEAMHRGVAELVRSGRQTLTSPFVLLGLLELEDSTAKRVLAELGVDSADLVQAVAEHVSQAPAEASAVPRPEPGDAGGQVQVQIDQEVLNVLNAAMKDAQSLGDKFVSTGTLLLGLIDVGSGAAGAVLQGAGLRYVAVRQALLAVRGGRTVERRDDETRPDVLGRYTTDLTLLARRGQLDPVVGREAEIQRGVEVLSRRKKNNPVLIGEPGVGKTVIVEGLAQRIVGAEVPESLLGKRVLSLDVAALVAGASVRGEFEGRVTALRDEVVAAKGTVILFIDELHAVVGAGKGGGGLDASDVLKPALARGLLQCIGASTSDDYRRFVEADRAFERRFQPIVVREPSVDETLEILRGLKGRYEAHHQVSYADEALQAAARMGDRYVADRLNPDKAVDLMDEAGAARRLQLVHVPQALRDMERRRTELLQHKAESFQEQDFERTARYQTELLSLERELAQARATADRDRADRSAVVGAEDVGRVVARWTGIPVERVLEAESEKLLRMEERLHRRIVGQEEAVSAVAGAIRRNRAGLRDDRRPIGSFLFLGPTGVGKTELARALAEFLFDDENRLIRLDLSEYMERHEVSKLVGAPPGYVGYDEGGQLTERVRRQPYSIVLFDEVEKAHPDFFNLLLQILDEGRLTDARGRTVSFRNTIVIGTSNLGSRRLASGKGLGFGSDEERAMPFAEAKRVVLEEARRFFKPEFLNRVDGMLVFHGLEREHLRAIAGLLLGRMRLRLADKGFRLTVAPAVVDKLVGDGFDRRFGARPLRRELERQLDDGLAPLLLKGEFRPGDEICADVSGGAMVFRKGPCDQGA